MEVFLGIFWGIILLLLFGNIRIRVIRKSKCSCGKEKKDKKEPKVQFDNKKKYSEFD